MFNLYGFLISLAIIAGVVAAEKVKGKLLASADDGGSWSVWEVLPWLVLPGLIGARLYHVADYSSYYLQKPVQILYLWQGGLGIFGAIIGAGFGLLAFAFRSRPSQPINNFLGLADLGAVGLPLGQAIGRWANFFNQELYGWPTKLPWGIYIKEENRLAGLERFRYFHPLFLYESLGCLLIFVFLILLLAKTSAKTRLGRLARKRGTVFFSYLFLYGLLRFFLEGLRPRSWLVRLPVFGPARVNQLVSLGLAIVGGFGLSRRLKNQKVVKPEKVNKLN